MISMYSQGENHWFRTTAEKNYSSKVITWSWLSFGQIIVFCFNLDDFTHMPPYKGHEYLGLSIFWKLEPLNQKLKLN